MEANKKEYMHEIISNIVSNLTYDEKQELFRSILQEDQKLLPISIFRGKISPLEATVRYLKDYIDIKFSDIARLLNRDISTIHNSYTKSLSKTEQIDESDNSILIPIIIFKDRKYSILESLVRYLHEECKMSTKDIANKIAKNYNTIKTIKSRYKSK